MAAMRAWTCDVHPEPPDRTLADASDRARDALVPTCGSCHRSDLPTAKPGALAIFDLTRDAWWVTIEDDEYDSLLGRVKGSKEIPDEDKTAVADFVAAIRRSSRPTPEP